MVSFSERLTVAPDVLFRLVGDEGVLLNLNTTLYLGLNPVGTRMWNALTSAGSIQAAYDNCSRSTRSNRRSCARTSKNSSSGCSARN